MEGERLRSPSLLQRALGTGPVVRLECANQGGLFRKPRVFHHDGVERSHHGALYWSPRKNQGVFRAQNALGIWHHGAAKDPSPRKTRGAVQIDKASRAMWSQGAQR